MKDLQRIEAKIDKLSDKLDAYSERTVKVETSLGWVRLGVSLIVSTLSALFYHLFMR